MEQIKIVECEIIDKTWRSKYTDGKINLEIKKARRLESRGMCKILDKDVEPKEKTVQNYKTKVMMASNTPLTASSFTVKKNVKVGWIQDYSKPKGGAELSNKHLISIGINLGFEIVVITPSQFSTRVLYQADILIINNFFEFPPDKMALVYNAIYEKRIPYVKYDHDVRELKRVNYSQQMFSQSVFNVFLSPEHLEASVKVLGSHLLEKSVCLPISINTNLYKVDKDIKRESNTVLVPTYKKGIDNVNKYIKDHPQYKFRVLGQVSFDGYGDIDIEQLPVHSPEDMVNLYNKYEFMLHIPQVLWAGERVFFEAILCGCKPIVNDMVGHQSWKFNNGDVKSKLTEANYTFWRMIENVCK